MPVKPFKMRGIGPHRPIIMVLAALLVILPVGAIFVAWQSHVATEIYQDYQIGQHAVPVTLGGGSWMEKLSGLEKSAEK